MQNPKVMVKEFMARMEDQFDCVVDGTISADELPKIVELITVEFIVKHSTNMIEILTSDDERSEDVLPDSGDDGSSIGDE